MNFRFTAGLFVVILLFGVVLLVRSFLAESPDNGSLLPSMAKIEAEQIDVLEIERQNPPGILKLERKGKDSWEIVEPIKTKAESTLVTAVIKALLRAKPTTFSERIPNLSITGLQPPSLKVTIRQGNERAATLNIGDIKNAGSSTNLSSATVFVSTQAKPDRAISVSRTDLDPLFRDTLVREGGKAGDLAKWTDDYRVKTVFPSEAGLNNDIVTALKLSLPNKKKELALSRTQSSGWKFDAPAGWGEADPVGDLSATPNTFSGMRPLLGSLTSIQALGPEDFIDNPKDLHEYGLNADNPDLVRVEMQTREGTVIAFIGKKEAGIPSTVPGSNPISKVWVRIEGQPGVIRANAGDLSGLIPVIENPDPLRDRTLVGAEKTQIDGIDIILGGQTTKLRVAGAWKLYGNEAAGDPQLASGPAINRLLDVLTARRTIKAFPASNPANFAPAEIKDELKVWVKGFEVPSDPKAEPKELSKPIVLLFGKREGDSIYVRRTMPDGTVGEYLVPDKIKLGGETNPVDLIPEVAKNRLDFLDKSLKTFSPFLASKVTVSGLENYELEKEERKEPSFKERWVFASPADKKGKTADGTAVSEMLQKLGTVSSVSRFVDETPTPAKLIEYGLASPMMPPPMSPPAPRLKVVIGLKGTDPADKERVYEFGVVSGDVVYARQVGKVAVFTLPKEVYDKFANPDLRDKAIFQFDPTQITGIELKGWKGATGFTTELNFEKNKEGGWTVTKSPGAYAVDPKKIDAFLNVLSTTTVKSFIPGEPTAEHGFGDEKTALIVVLKTASGPVLSMNLGATTDGGASYFGWLASLPDKNRIYTVDAARFKIYKDSPAAFSK